MPSDGDLPVGAVVLLVGPSGAGKSTWAAGLGAEVVVLSSDAFRELVAGDAADQEASSDAFRALHLVAHARLRRGLTTVIDATNLSPGARRPFLVAARRFGRPSVAVVFDPPLPELLARNARRLGRVVPEDVVRRHAGQMARVRGELLGEGYARIIVVEEGGPSLAASV